MSTRSSRFLWEVPGTTWGIHVYREMHDHLTYIDLGPDRGPVCFQWPCFWRGNPWRER